MKIVADANIPYAADCFSCIGEVRVVGGREMRRDTVSDADVLLVRSITRVNADLLEGSRVRFVGTATIGFDHVDTGYLREANIGFASAPGSNANSAAEYVTAGLLAAGRRCGIELEGKSIGVIGAGNVGSRVAKKCSGLGMKVFLNDPPLRRQTGDTKYLPLEELYDCNFITLHTPLTFEGADKTYHLADEGFFKSLKDDCVFINASRGAVADGGALKTAIRSGRFDFVVLDVWENEPDIDTGLLGLTGIGTPHIAGYSLDGKITGMIMIYEAVCEYFGLKPKYHIEDFLPEPAVGELEIESSGDEQETIAGIVRKIYDIREDDTMLREISKKPEDKRGEYFDGLRKNYRVRREFQNTKVVVGDTGGSLARKLDRIGFQIVEEK
jgi:erythronate-4-phosphate dehydrogenase